MVKQILKLWTGKTCGRLLPWTMAATLRSPKKKEKMTPVGGSRDRARPKRSRRDGGGGWYQKKEESTEITRDKLFNGDEEKGRKD